MAHRLVVLATLAVLVLAAAAPAAPLAPADVERATAEATRGLRSVTKRLTAPGFAGRDNGTPESDHVQRMLIRRLRRLGAGLRSDAAGDDAYRQPFVENMQSGTNLLAVIRGRELPDEYVIVGGHYDHLDSRSNAAGDCSRNRPPGGALCPGATDNATGTAVVLAIGKALRELPVPPRRSVILALWDAEEDGLLGSLHYVTHPLVPLDRTVAYVNFDIQGANLLPSLRDTSFSVGAETGGSALGAFVQAAVAAEGLQTLPVSFIFGQLRSDYANFVLQGSVPTVFFSDSTGGCYHTTGDTYEVVDPRKLARQSRIGFRTTLALAEADGRPPFRAPNPALATFADAVAVREVFLRARFDLGVFPPDDRLLVERIGTEVDAVVAAGPAAFDTDAVAVVLNAAVQGINALTRLPCRRY